MLKLKEVEVELAAIRKEGSQATFKDLRRIKKRIEYLEMIRLYLLTKPSEQTVQKQVEAVQRVLNVINDRYYEWSREKQGGGQVLRRQFDGLYEVRKLKIQLRTMKYILGHDV
jgi:hypothetical protein